MNSWESGFSLLHTRSNQLSTMGLKNKSIYKAYVFYFHHGDTFYSVQLQSLSVFCFHFPHFFRMILYCFKKLTPIQLLSAAISKGNKEKNSVIRGGYLKGHKPPFCIGVKFSDTFKTQMKQEK